MYSAEQLKGNTFARKWKTPGALKRDVNKYFKMCEEKGSPLTITGLALALGTNRQTLINYQKNLGGEFDTIIKKAKLMVEGYAEQYLYTGRNVAGAIFNLKNNYGWIDKKEIEHSGGFMVDLIKKANEDKQSGGEESPKEDKE